MAASFRDLLFAFHNNILVLMQTGCDVFCLCNKTWDPEEPMLGCDLCEEWFHYDCMGLRKPGDDEVDADVAPQNYRCPFCCRKVAYLPVLIL